MSDDESVNDNSVVSISTEMSEQAMEEEATDIYQLEIEEAVAQYRNEPRIRHDVCADSDSETEDVPVVKVKSSQQIKRRRGGALFVGKAYASGVAFKENVLDFALSTGYNIKQDRWEQTKLSYKCGTGKCPWRVYCSVNKGKNRWEIKRLVEPHLCSQNGKCEMITDPIIARLFVDKIREDPEYFMPKKIQELVRELYKGISVTRDQCQEGRKKALRWIKEEYEDQFAHIRGYCEQILKSNPGSTVEVVTKRGAGGEDIFERFYVCFKVLKESWKRNCRRLIGVDGTFLRGTTKGMLLVAQGRDADNCIYPIAWAVVEVEDEISWVWFIKKLQVDLELGDGAGFIIMSDRQKGLINAVHKEIPKAEHRKCVRHIYQNIKAQHGRKMELKPFIWQLAWSTNETEYKKNLDKIKDYDEEVFNDVNKRDPKSWCLAFYKIEGNCCEDVENNSVESFNNTIVKPRERPVMPMLEMIRRLAMVRINTRFTVAKSYQGMCTPYVKERLEETLEDAQSSKVYPGSTGIYEVEVKGQYESVDMRKKECTCCRWQISGIPCVHAYGVILYTRDNTDKYVSDWFHTSRWRDTYEHAPRPVRGPDSWIRGDIALVCEDPERKKKNTKEKIKRSANESPTKKKKKKSSYMEEDNVVEFNKPDKRRRHMHCTICGGQGHNMRSCVKSNKDHGGSSSTQAVAQPLSQSLPQPLSQPFSQVDDA